MKAGARILVPLLACALTSCSGARREKILGILFDDPPAPSAGAVADSARVVAEAVLPAAEPREGTPAPTRFLHPPYADRECDSCHAVGSSKSFRTFPWIGAGGGDVHASRLLYTKDTICFECHDDMSYDALDEEWDYVHPPTDGECLECHDPHQSPYPFMLRAGDPLETVCFRCHDGEDVLGAPPHAGVAVDERTCTNCHDPHASDQEFLLRSRVP